MNNRSKGREWELKARQEWTERLNRFAEAKTGKQRQAVLEPGLKINPGGTLRSLLEAWGYSASSRGRKAKGTERKQDAKEESKPARERLEGALEELFGVDRTPIPSLYPKLAGRADATVSDAFRIVAALVISWPAPLSVLKDGKSPEDRKQIALEFAEVIIRELLSCLSGQRSRNWKAEDMAIRAFKLVDENRVGVSQFIRDAGEKEGSLIVTGSRNILVGPDPISTIQQFNSLTSQFVGENHQGLLIFVFDAALFEAGEEGFRLLYNVGLLSTAMTAFAFFQGTLGDIQPVRKHRVDWSRWRALSARCCVVLRKPSTIDPSSGELLKREKFDEFITSWRYEHGFARLEELVGFVRFDTGHVMPRRYPSGLGNPETLGGRDLYWNVLVRPARNAPEGLEVQYFTPPYDVKSGATQPLETRHRGRGRPSSKLLPIEEDFIYMIKYKSPGLLYDEAQRAIYMAARGRLNLDQGDRHIENLNAAAALRQVGYEVLPISTMLSLFPRLLHIAAVRAQPGSDIRTSDTAAVKDR